MNKTLYRPFEFKISAGKKSLYKTKSRLRSSNLYKVIDNKEDSIHNITNMNIEPAPELSDLQLSDLETSNPDLNNTIMVFDSEYNDDSDNSYNYNSDKDNYSDSKYLEDNIENIENI